MPLLAAPASALSIAPAYADLGDQLFELLPDDGAEQDLFGRSVAISGGTAIVGAQLHRLNGLSARATTACRRAEVLSIGHA